MEEIKKTSKHIFILAVDAPSAKSILAPKTPEEIELYIEYKLETNLLQITQKDLVYKEKDGIIFRKEIEL